VSFLAWTLGEHCLIVPPSKVNISSLSETGIDDFYSLATPKVVVGSLILASWSHYVPGQLEPFSIILQLGSTDSAFSLQSTPYLSLYLLTFLKPTQRYLNSNVRRCSGDMKRSRSFRPVWKR